MKKNIKIINIRKFHREFYTEFKGFPIIVTRYKKPLFVVVDYEWFKKKRRKNE